MSQTKQSHPDAELHPEATGLAKQTVSQHTQTQDLKLYSGWFCPFVQRAWLVLEEKKIPYEYIEVNPYHKPASLLSLNPRGLVPTLQYDNKPLYESTVICQFLEEAYPEHGVSLLPKDVYDRARMRIWIDWITSRCIPSYHRFLQKQGEVDAERREFLGLLKEFAKEMDESGPYFFGAEPKMIDFMLAPWAVRLWVFGTFLFDLSKIVSWPYTFCFTFSKWDLLTLNLLIQITTKADSTCQKRARQEKTKRSGRDGGRGLVLLKREIV